MLRPLYDCNGITIYCGDCRDVLPAIAADVLVTDPPYGVDYRSGWGADHPRIAGDSDVGVRDEVLSLWGHRPAVVFGSWRAARPSGVRARLIWSKAPDPGMGDLTFPWGNSDEEIYILGRGFTGRRSANVLTFPKPAVAGRRHPTPKPVALMSHLIERCPPGVIVDPFMGSGSTLRAAKDLGRKAIGIELDASYCDLAIQGLRQGALFGGAQC